ncbi:MAG: DUF4093 domain-containing protein [Ruminococcus sp.]|nr:DUF4093 domain-containing protein [Ruminococcus sp.]
MLKIKEAIIVEGKYDKMKLKSLVDTPVIATNGFRVFKDKEKQNLIRQVANSRGVLILTDSDSAGFVIRNFLKGSVPSEKIKNCYIPEIKGKEKRKDAPSKEGFLGVEGVSDDIIINAVKQSGATILNSDETVKNINDEITKTLFFQLGLTGAENSKSLRTELLKSLNLPVYLTTNAMIEALNCLLTANELQDKVNEIKNK